MLTLDDVDFCNSLSIRIGHTGLRKFKKTINYKVFQFDIR